MASNGRLLMTRSDNDLKETVERALATYRERSRQVAPYVQAAVAGKIQVPPQSLSSEVWLTYALYWEGSKKTLEELIRDADVVGHSLPSAKEIAWTLLSLRNRGWLSIQGELFGLTPEGMQTIKTVVATGNLRERYQRLTTWISSHSPKSNE